MAVDLHIHTTASDGTMSPAEVVILAARNGLSAIAITDHDTIEGVKPALEQGRISNIEVVTGVELSCTFANKDVHILGYFVDIEDQNLEGHLRELRNQRFERARKMVDAMCEDGMDICMDDLLDISGPGSVGRLHIAKLLVKRGIAHDIDRAFTDLIGRRSKYFFAKPSRRPEEVIETIHKCGGLAVLAHPMMLRDDRLVRELMTLRLDGIEVYHTDQGSAAQKYYVREANNANLAITGGSDFHGLTEKRGHADALCSLPDELLDGLKKIKARSASY